MIVDLRSVQPCFQISLSLRKYFELGKKKKTFDPSCDSRILKSMFNFGPLDFCPSCKRTRGRMLTFSRTKDVASALQKLVGSVV